MLFYPVNKTHFASDTLLMGREIYEGFAASWPFRTAADDGPGEEGFVDRINGLPKFVASTTLKEPLEWNNSHLIKQNVVEEISKLKQQPGQDILVGGSGQLVQTLREHNLVDQYTLLVYPVVLGKGKRLFKEGINSTLKLVETKSYDTGVVLTVYKPA